MTFLQFFVEFLVDFAKKSLGEFWLFSLFLGLATKKKSHGFPWCHFNLMEEITGKGV